MSDEASVESWLMIGVFIPIILVLIAAVLFHFLKNSLNYAIFKLAQTLLKVLNHEKTTPK
ncbi:hypothetical protein EFS27_01565 [Leuconostoc mesenteroides]|uniref:hypothetical protein n=1 Tax=Leuconostoc mesenteroides TaxID=1245 RepID=UPI0021A34429|nr:hypothetical protein [Leuconostoc mesenteroides]MCT3038011.1 hypothetical protein [Leuconostoc mesenteroides]